MLSSVYDLGCTQVPRPLAPPPPFAAVAGAGMRLEPVASGLVAKGNLDVTHSVLQRHAACLTSHARQVSVVCPLSLLFVCVCVCLDCLSMGGGSVYG